MRVIIAGSRGITDYAEVEYAMSVAALFDITPTTVFSGGASGVDRLGERWAKAHDCYVHLFLPVWRDANNKLDRSAGMRRNEDMCRAADALVAVWDGTSTGTKQCIEFARKRRLAIYVHEVRK